VNRVDPTGKQTLLEVFAAISIEDANAFAGATAFLNNFYNGYLPDAVGFGAFGSAAVEYALNLLGKQGSLAGGLILGGEVVIAPRLKQVGVYLFGGRGASAAGTTKTGAGFDLSADVYESWYWNFDFPKQQPFAFNLVSVSGYFFGTSINSGTIERFSGFTFAGLPSTGIYSARGSEVLALGPWNLSPGLMIALVTGLQGLFSAGYFRPPITGIAGLGAVIVSTGAAPFWVGLTYGRK
jgi:hypothetical protein